MSDPNISLFQPTKTSGVRKLHHKLMVIDERIVVAGSFNYTEPANDYNDENIFVLGIGGPGQPRRRGRAAARRASSPAT